MAYYLQGFSFSTRGTKAKTPNILPHLNTDWFYPSGTGLPRFSSKRGCKIGACIVVVIQEEQENHGAIGYQRFILKIGVKMGFVLLYCFLLILVAYSWHTVRYRPFHFMLIALSLTCPLVSSSSQS